MLRALSLCACCRPYPGAATGRRSRSSHPAVTAFPDNVVGSACTSSFSRPAQRSLALRPAHSRGHLYVTSYTEGFSHFVTSMTAPVASGWSGCRVGLAPTGKRRLGTAHTSSGRSGAWLGRLSWADSDPTVLAYGTPAIGRISGRRGWRRWRAQLGGSRHSEPSPKGAMAGVNRDRTASSRKTSKFTHRN